VSVTKLELTDLVCEQMDVDKKMAGELVDQFFEEIKRGIKRDGVVIIAGFGKFIVQQKRARKGRNPKTGKEMEITPRKVVTFQHSQVLKKRLNLK